MRAFAVAVAAGTLIASAWAQPAANPGTPDQASPAAPVPPPPPIDPNAKAASIVVMSITGSVGYKAPGATKAKGGVKVGDVLALGGEVVTGVSGQVQIRVGDQHSFIVDSNSRVILREAALTNDRATTEVGLPMGRVKFDVTSATRANDVKITAPDATLAIKGTSGAMEVRPGFPTLAYGGAFNRGNFDVRYRGSIVANVERQARTDSVFIDPAENQENALFVEIGDDRAREFDERRFVRRFTRLFQLVFGEANPQGLGIPPAITGLFQLDEATGTIGIFDPVSGYTPFLDLTGFDPNPEFLGNALGVNPRTQATTFLRLEQNGSMARLLSIDIDGVDTAFNTVATFDLTNISATISGLAQLDNRLYTNLSPDDENFDVLGRLEFGPNRIQPVMNLGIPFDSGLGVLSGRGTVLTVGRLADTGITNGTPGVLGANAALLELDPRNNYLRSAFSDVNDDFAFDPFGTFVLDPFVDPSFAVITNQDVTGLARFAVTPGSFVGVTQDVLVLGITVNALVDGLPTTLSITYNTQASNTPGDPRVFVITSSPTPVRDLASELRVTPQAPRALASAPGFPIDTSLPALFAQLAYSQQALNSGVVERLARNQILETARDPIGCANSGALGGLGTPLQTYVDTRAGMGAAITAFRMGLPANHPCLAAPGRRRG